MNIDSMIQGNPQALVTSYNGVLVADSLEVADRFGKRHTHVLRSIDDLINQLESQSTQNWADYFIPDDYQDNKNRTQRRFKLTRDGFSLLVMGFTGPAALHWKLLYIEAFNKMEQALRSNVDIRQLVTQITTDVRRPIAGSGAASFDKSLAGSYVTTTGLYMRHGAGKNKRAMVLIPEGTKVQNYGYYTSYNGTKWLYIQVTLNGVQYTGFSCKTYLKKQ